MKIKLNYILIVFTFAFSISCVNINNQNANIDINNKVLTNKYTFVELDTIAIKLNKITKYNGVFTPQVIDNILYISYLNKDYNTNIIYDINKGSLSKELKFNHSGPDGVGEVLYSYIQNWDSIFVIRYHTNQLFLVDSTLAIKNKWILDYTTTTNEPIFNIAATYYFKFNKYSDRLYFMNIPPHKVYTPEYWNSHTSIMIDIKSKEIKFLAGTFPDIYKKGINYGKWNYSDYRIVNKIGNQVYSYPLDNNLYIYNDTALIKKVSCKSPHVETDAPKPTKTLTGYNYDDDWQYEMNRGSYRYLWYDKFNDLIYRLVVHSMEPYDTEGNKNKFWDKPFSIQIIDSTFTLIGEVDFPERQYAFYNIIPSKDGLLISLCHDDNPILEEDKLKLARFELVKKDD